MGRIVLIKVLLFTKTIIGRSLTKPSVIPILKIYIWVYLRTVVGFIRIPKPDTNK